jgi:hypothetical protein
MYCEAREKYKWPIFKSLEHQDKGGVKKDSPGRQLPAYTPDVFIRYLARWIVADDQVSVVLSHFR